jgi:hypothetical protein
MRLLPLLAVALSLSLAACGREPGLRETLDHKDPLVRKCTRHSGVSGVQGPAGAQGPKDLRAPQARRVTKERRAKLQP